MAGNATPDQVADSGAMTDAARIRELMLAHLFAVFNERDPDHVSRDLGLLAFNLGVPEQPPAVSGVDVALVRDGRIAALSTILTAQS